MGGGFVKTFNGRFFKIFLTWLPHNGALEIKFYYIKIIALKRTHVCFYLSMKPSGSYGTVTVSG